MDNRNNSNTPYPYDPDNTPTYEPFDDCTATRSDIAVPPSDINHSTSHAHQYNTYKNYSETDDFPQKEWDNQDTMVVPPPAAPHYNDTKIYKQPQADRQPPPPLKPVRRNTPYPQQPAPQQPYQQIQQPYQQPAPYQTGSFQAPPYQPPVVPHYEPPTPIASQGHNKKKDSNPTLIVLTTLLAVMIVLLLIFGGIFLFRNKDDSGNSASYSASSSSYSSSVSDIDRDPANEELKLPYVGDSWVSILDHNKIKEHEPYVKLVENLPKNNCFFLCDINGEGTPELFITSESSAIKTIYTLDNGSVSTLIDCSNEKNGKLDLCTNGMIAHTYKDNGTSGITYLKLYSGGDISPFETVEESNGDLHYSYNGQRFQITSKEADKIHSRYTSMQFTPTLISAVDFVTSSVNAYIETFDHSALNYFSSYLVASGDFDHIDVNVKGPENQNRSYTFTKAECNASIFLLDYEKYSSDAYIEVTPYDKKNKAGEKVKCVFPSAVKSTIKDKVISQPVAPIKGLIDCPNGGLQGFDASYVLNAGDVKTVRDKLDHGIPVIAKNEAFNYDVHWYEVWNSDTGDYYGWVDENFINFNIPQEDEPPTTFPRIEPTNSDNEDSDSDLWDDDFWKNWFT